MAGTEEAPHEGIVDPRAVGVEERAAGGRAPGVAFGLDWNQLRGERPGKKTQKKAFKIPKKNLLKNAN